MNGETDLVRQIFLPPNVQSILSIFFSSYLPQDQLVWAYTPKEKFTVRSAYKIALDRDGTRIQSWGDENQNYHLLRIMHNPSEYFLVSILSVFNFQIFATAPAVKSPFSYHYQQEQCYIFFIFGGGPSLALDEAMNSGVGEPSNDDTHKKIWRKIWSLNMLNKVNSFAWRACRNILPTKANLCRMYVKLVDSV